MAQQYAQQQQQQQQQDEDLARLQELSNKWEPEATGPLVSELLDINAIINEYANADPIYQAKTAGLPHTFSNYRSCRGDGHCGWRAVAFCYFETLIRIGDIYKFQEEVIRLRSLRNILHDAGFDETIYEDFADDTYGLLEMVSTAQDPATVVLNAFNDMNQSMSIITYLKLLTSAWMQKHPESYQDYLQEPVQSYCHSRIEPAVCEIEEVGLSALIAVLIRPAGISAEVHYLDRSSGSTLSVYEYESPEARSLAHVFRLLYRPGHYDILYKTTDLLTTHHPTQPTSQPNTQQNVFVALQHDSTDLTHQRTAYHPGPSMIELPGMSFYGGPNTSWVQSFSQYDVSPSPISPAITSPQAPVTPTYPSVSSVPHTQEMYMQPTTMSQAVPMSQSSMSSIALPHHPHPRMNSDGPFRRSAWELENIGIPSQYQMCTTAIFRNSHYNTAHFNNPDFEPEQWQPESDYSCTERSRKKSSHSS